MRSRVDGVLNRLNLPSKADVESLNARISILTRKVDQMQAGQTDPEPPKPSQ